jgi:hypothetical protein
MSTISSAPKPIAPNLLRRPCAFALETLNAAPQGHDSACRLTWRQCNGFFYDPINLAKMLTVLARKQRHRRDKSTPLRHRHDRPGGGRKQKLTISQSR